MKIFAHEIQDGLISLSNVTRAECSIVANDDLTVNVNDHVLKTIARYAPSNPNQIDLHYLNCVLASTCINKNDDDFTPEEMWAARSTPEDKPFNYSHDESDIIGHITGSISVDSDGKEINDIIDEFDIVTSAVIYKAWSDLEQSIRIKQLIDEINDGEWSVSMECLFKNFDYSLIGPDGVKRVVARNEESAFLTKHLRAYGGTGKYENYKIARLLRNITFSGIGIVKRPANARSVILNTKNLLGDILMTEPLTQVAASENDDLTVKVTELQTALDAASASVAEKDAVIEEQNKTITSLTAEIAAEKTAKASINEELAALKSEVRSMKRYQSLSSMNLDEVTIAGFLNQCKDVEDDAFNGMVAMLKAMKPMASEVDTNTETEEVVEETVEAEVDVEEDTSEAALHDAGDDENVEVSTARASVSNWFSTKVLKTTQSLK